METCISKETSSHSEDDLMARGWEPWDKEVGTALGIVDSVLTTEPVYLLLSNTATYWPEAFPKPPTSTMVKESPK